MPDDRPVIERFDQWQSLPPVAVTVWRIRVTIGAIAVVATTGLVIALLAVLKGGPSTRPLAQVFGAVALTAVVLGASLAAFAPITLRRRRWRVSTEWVENEYGVTTRWFERVPRDRLHTAIVRSGPVQRRYGLATVVIHGSGELVATHLALLSAAVADELIVDLGFRDER